MTKSGIDKRYFDSSARPQDDLFRHVNGKWLEEYEIPADRASDGAFRELYDTAEEQVREIIEELGGPGAQEEASGHEGQLVGALYASFMDEAAIAARGTEPLEEDLALIREAATKEELTQAMGRLDRSGVGGLFGCWVDTDPDDPDRYVTNLTQGGISLPDESYYREEQYEEIRGLFREHVAAMFTLADKAFGAGGRPDFLEGQDAKQLALSVFEAEKRLASAHWDVVRDRDDTETHNPMTLAELRGTAPQWAWDAWLSGAETPRGAFDRLIVREPSFFEAMGQLWDELDLRTWKILAWWNIVHCRAAYVTSDFVDENFHFYGTVLSGTPTIRERWKRGVGLVQGVLGEAVGKVYVARHFPPEHKARVQKLVHNLLEAYRESITNLDWLGADTKKKALEKLDQFTPKIGYPDVWRDYSQLQLASGDLVGNIRAASAHEADREFAKIGKPVDRAEWFMTPQTVNAYYNPGMNEIVFPAAILQAPFFDAEADDAANYGGIGAVIGHEIGHGFDDQGSKYDGRGALVDWWTDEDRAEFTKRTQALIAQFDALVPSNLLGSGKGEGGTDPHVNGALTIGENIGDLGGLAIAIKAYRISQARSAAGNTIEGPSIGGMSAAERFFFGWAQCWRGKHRPEESIRRLATDPHSPDEWRCNGVMRNIDEFHEAFRTKEGDKLWLAARERVVIW